MRLRTKGLISSLSRRERERERERGVLNYILHVSETEKNGVVSSVQEATETRRDLFSSVMQFHGSIIGDRSNNPSHHEWFSITELSGLEFVPRCEP